MRGQDMTDQFVAIVIGSGVSGGWAAKELTEKGLKVLMLDRGVMVEHGADYDYDGRPAYEIPARDRMPEPLVKSDYFIATHGYVSPSNQKFYNNDRLNPYARSEEHTSELQSLMRISYAVFCLNKKNTHL